MKKKILAVAVALLSVGSIVSAQTPDNGTPAAETTTSVCHNGKRDCQRPDGCRQDRKHGSRHGRHDGQRPDMFAGITLTAEQQQALDSLRQQQRADRQQKAQERRAIADQERQARRAAIDEQVKAILTPEQYAQYEKNVAEMQARRESMGKDTVINCDRRGKDMRRGDGKNRRHDGGRRHGQAPATQTSDKASE